MYARLGFGLDTQKVIDPRKEDLEDFVVGAN
jgi:hypothetical protein